MVQQSLSHEFQMTRPPQDKQKSNLTLRTKPVPLCNPQTPTQDLNMSPTNKRVICVNQSFHPQTISLTLACCSGSITIILHCIYNDTACSLVNGFVYSIYSLTAVGALPSRHNTDSMHSHVFHPVTSLRQKAEVML